MVDCSDSPTRKPLLRALKGEVLNPPPFWLMRQAGRYLPEYREVRGKVPGFLDLCYSAELAARLTLQPVERFGMDAAIVFSDILVVPDALGQTVEFREGEGPRLAPIRSFDALRRLSLDGFCDRLAPVYEAVRLARRALSAETALIGFAGAPWTVAAYMIEGGGSADFAAAKGWVRERPGEFRGLIDLLIEATAMHIIAQADAGAEAIQLFESWAGLLAEPQFTEWSVGPMREIVRRFKRVHPEVPVIVFPRGAGALYAKVPDGTGVEAISMDPAVSVDWAARELQSRCVVQGNLDPSVLVAGGPAMCREVERILAALGSGPFIFNLGHGVLPNTPLGHVAELARLIRRWRA